MNRQKKPINQKKPEKEYIDIEPTLQDYIDFLNKYPELLLKEKNEYTAEGLMMLLDNERLAALEEEFEEHQNGIELPNFIWLMKSAISPGEDKKYELVNGLIKLFQDIDINGDKHMEWSEFTQYIIDAVIGEKDAKFFDARFEKDRELTENEILDRAYSRKTKRYIQSQFKDTNTHTNVIKKIQYSKNTDWLCCLEQSSNRLKFYRPTDCTEVMVGDHNKKYKFNIQIPLEESQNAFIMDFAIAEELNQLAVITSDRQIYIWENQQPTNNQPIRVQKNFKMDVLLTGIWYLPIHKVWITAGGDYNIRTWNFQASEDKKKIQPKLLLKAHMKQITCICELEFPKLVASCSLDGKIKLWDITDQSNPVNKTELKDQSNDNKRGILGMNYSGTNLLTYGFDNHINIWCPQVSITRAFIGKLEGHSSLVVQCKFIEQSPNVISIDDKGNIRIWDIRTMGTIQVITSDSQYCLVTDIALIQNDKHDRFVVSGKRLQFYENAAISKSMKSINDDLSVLQVEFNTYYNQFVLLTKIDIRCYDAMTGKLRKVFNEVYDDKFSVDLCCFCFGGGDRKFYLADNAGLIRQYNMKNGEFLKNVNTLNEIEKSEFSKKQSHIKKKENNEISQIMYNHEEKLLIAAYQDSTIRIYDESDAEESVILKVLSGAHRDSEISSIAYSPKINFLASGSTNGIIALWNFETGKCDNLLLSDQTSIHITDNSNNNFEITALQFADPYPILVSATFGGVIMVWGIGPKANNYKYKCIAKIHNSYWQDGIRIQNPQITSLTIESGNKLEKVIRQPFLEDPFAPPQGFGDPIIQQNNSPEKKKNKKVQLGNNPQTAINNLTGGLGSQKKASFMKGEKEDYAVFSQYWNIYENEVEKQRRLYVYFCDIKGYMHCLHLTDMLKNRDIQPIITPNKKKQSFQLRRKDLINASKVVENMLSSPDRLQLDEHVVEMHGVNSVLVKRWKAHKEKINSITKLTEPVCYITCSVDKTVKIWSMKGEQYCQINLVKFHDKKENFWNFPFSWVNQKLKDIDHVFDSLNIIDNENLTDMEKEEIKKKYLFNKYFNDMEYNKMIYELRRARSINFDKQEEEEEKKAQQVPKFKRLKAQDPREIITQKLSDLDEHLHDVETRKININFSTQYKHQETELPNLFTIKGLTTSNNFKAAVLFPSLDNTKRYNLSFRIINLEGVIGFGLCLKNVVEDFDYEFSQEDLEKPGHGMYIITTDLKAYSHHNGDQNNIPTNFKNFKYSKTQEIINLKIYPYSQQLVFQLENGRYSFTHELQFENQGDLPDNRYSLVALVQHEEDQIEYYGGESIHQKNRVTLGYKNMGNPKDYTEMKQRIGLLSRPDSSYYRCDKLLRNFDKNSRPSTGPVDNIQDQNQKKIKEIIKKPAKKKEQQNLHLISTSKKTLDKFYDNYDQQQRTYLKPSSSNQNARGNNISRSSSQQKFHQTATHLGKSNREEQRQQVKFQKKQDKVFSMSQTSLKKNNDHIQNIIKEFDVRPNTRDKYLFQKDIKYKVGEGQRQMRVASNQYSYEIASMSPQVLFTENEVLTKKYKFYKELSQKQKGDKNMGNEDYDDDDDEADYRLQQEQQKKMPQIVATRNFWNNPVRNQHKIFKTGKKIYVIEQEQ